MIDIKAYNEMQLHANAAINLKRQNEFQWKKVMFHPDKARKSLHSPVGLCMYWN